MFSNVRVNQQIYILDKANGICEVGNVCEQPVLRNDTVQPKQQPNTPYAFQQTVYIQVVDLKVRTPSGVQTLNKIPANDTVFEDEAKTFYITDNKELMLNELKSLKNQSEYHVKQTPYHQEMIGKYGNWIAMLSPEEAEKKQMAQRVESLEKMNADLVQQLQTLISKLDGERTKPTKNKSNEKNEDN